MTASVPSTTQFPSLCIPTTSILHIKPYLLQINANSGESVMIIEEDGTVLYRVDGVLKRVECDSELSQLFVSVICGITGFSVQNKNELFKTIAHNYRNGQLDNIFKQSSNNLKTQ